MTLRFKKRGEKALERALHNENAFPSAPSSAPPRLVSSSSSGLSGSASSSTAAIATGSRRGRRGNTDEDEQSEGKTPVVARMGEAEMHRHKRELAEDEDE
jgi:hypothetical protein